MVERRLHVRKHAPQLSLGLLAIALALAGCGMPPPDAAATSTAPAVAVAALGSTTIRGSTPTVQTIRPVLPTPTPLPTAAPPPTSTPTTVAQKTADPTAVPLTTSERTAIFDQVWQMVRDNYLYSDFGGADWEALRLEYAERIAAAEDDEAFYALMVELVAHLDDNHSRFVPPSEVLHEDAFTSGREAYAGIGVMTLPGRDGAFIQLVFPDSPAARADIRPRDRIIAVNNRPYRQEDGDLQGPPGTKVRLSVVRPGSRPRDVVLVRQEVQGRIVPTHRRFPGDIGYVWVSTLWVNDMDEQVSGALTELVAAGKLNGLILDLRGNRGGWGHVMNGILSHFVRGQVGMFFNRKHVRPLVISAPAGPDLRSLSGKLAVLVDEDTASYAEVVAAVLQREANAIVVGVRSSGNTETIYAHALSDGSRLWLAEEGFRLQDGTNLEEQGVLPDSSIDVNWKRYSEDDDPQLLEALRLLGAGPK